jgi:hypothetical protein
MNDQQLITLWLGSLRYYLGRQTYAVSDFCELLIQSWPTLPEALRSLIQRDIEGEFMRDDKARAIDGEHLFLPLGMDCDRAEWEKVRGLWAKCNNQK